MALLLPAGASTQASQCLQHRPICLPRTKLFDTLPAPNPEGFLTRQAGEKRLDQGGLANAGLARDEDEVPLAVLRSRKPVRQLRQGGLTTDHGRPAARRL